MPYLDNLSGLLSNVDLIISRAGAGTISEILALEIPSILIPSPYVANNHQYYNALDLKNKKVSIMIEEKDLNANNMYKLINNLLNNSEQYNNIKTNFKKLSTKNAGSIIYESIKEIINE